MTQRLSRALRNAFAGWFRLAAWFPAAALERIHQAIRAGEALHLGEVCFTVESRLHPLAVLRGLTPRQRAEHAFAKLRVWDTAHNTGVLVYVLLSERRVEIVADRGIAARVAQAEWQRICAELAARFAAGEPEAGAIAAIAAIHDLLARHFPAAGQSNPNERPDAPVVL